MKIWSSTSTATIAIATTMGLCGAVQAQGQTTSAASAESAEAQQGIQDIIVTASRREQTLQSTAIPVTAISGKDLEQKGVSNIKDLTTLIPSLKIGELTTGALQITTRGVGTFGGNNFAEPGVSVNLDGAYVPRTQGANGTFYDVARIELLKGPQGTLYGRNTTGGVLNIITNNPTDTFGGNVKVEAGNYSRLQASGALNIPLAEGVAIRFAGQAVDREGYLSDGYGDESGYAGRAKLKVDATENLSILLEANYTKVKGRGNLTVISPFLDPNNPYVGLSDPRSTALYGQAPVAPPLRGVLPRPNANGFQRNTTLGLKANVDYDFGGVKATAIVNHVRTTAHYLQFGNGFPVTDDTRDTPIKYTTAELRLASDNTGPLKWVLGAFYFQDKNRTSAVVDQGTTFADTRDLQNRVKSYSGFGEATYAVTPSVRVTLGGRYTTDKKELEGLVVNPGSPPFLGAPVPPCFAPGVIGTAPGRVGPVCLTSEKGSATFSKFTYKIGIDADIGEHSLVYANFSTGFKSGGFFAAANTAAPGAFPTNGYRPENIKAWTIGSKNRFFDNTLQINLEGFYWKYKNKQISHLGFTPPANVVLVVDNAGDASIYGAELEAKWQPTANDSLNLNVQYQHSKYDKYAYNQVIPGWAQPGVNTLIPNTGCAFSPTRGVGGAPRGTGVPGLSTIDCSGRPISLAPSWTATASYSHTFDLGSSGSIVPFVSTNVSSGYWAGEEYYVGQYQKSFIKSDASLTYNTADKALSLTVFVNNIEDKAVIQSALIQSSLLRSLAYLGAPRTYGIRAGVRF